MPKAPDSGRTRAPKAWSGRLQQPSSPTLETYSTSLPWDGELGQFDILGSRAHAGALHRAGLIDEDSHDRILRGLEAISEELAGGSFQTLESDEDIHMAVERRLTELVGDPGRRLHTGRSRNDQVALDLRLYARAACTRLVRAGAEFENALLKRAREERGTVLPGYTHLQRGQAVHLGHHLLAYFEMISRDLDRLRSCHRRLNVSPLGAAALAGTTLPIERGEAAAELGFAALTANSLDAVSDRDFAVELTFCCALMGVHLSRLAEDLIIWNTAEFSFATLPDAWATGSSLMPQKKNPDLLELVRGRSAVPIASLVGLLTLLKGLPLSYNRDLQEDRRHLFAAVDVAESSLLALTGLLLE
nr:argininosuccinate lyase [Candidatus Dormibacteraeota bacterium]